MKIVSTGTVTRLELTRRNLETLLRKLDHNRSEPPAELRSACTLELREHGTAVIVRAVENEEHYANREPGPVLDNATGRLT